MIRRMEINEHYFEKDFFTTNKTIFFKNQGILVKKNRRENY